MACDRMFDSKILYFNRFTKHHCTELNISLMAFYHAQHYPATINIVELSSTALKILMYRIESEDEIFSLQNILHNEVLPLSPSECHTSSGDLNADYIHHNITSHISQYQNTIQTDDNPTLKIIISTGFQYEIGQGTMEQLVSHLGSHFPKADIEVLTGTREGYYSFHSYLHSPIDLNDRVLYFDIGGRTTNIVFNIRDTFHYFELDIGYNSFDTSRVRVETGNFYDSAIDQLDALFKMIDWFFEGQEFQWCVSQLRQSPPNSIIYNCSKLRELLKLHSSQFGYPLHSMVSELEIHYFRMRKNLLKEVRKTDAHKDIHWHHIQRRIAFVIPLYMTHSILKNTQQFSVFVCTAGLRFGVLNSQHGH